MKYLLKRTGALGDVLELTAITHRLKSLGHSVCVSTHYPQIFIDNDDIELHSGDVNRMINLDFAFENDLRKLHPIDSFSHRVFGDLLTPHKLFFKFPRLKNLRIADQDITHPLVVLHPARSWPIRTLSHNFWQDLIDALVFEGFKVILTGTVQDWHGLQNCVDTRGAFDLQHQASLIDFADVFICTESGPMILAQTTSTPVIPLLTMVPPEHIIHDGAKVHPIRANVPCIGCAARQPTPTTYFDCEHGSGPKFRSCVADSSFDINQIVGLSLDLTSKGKSNG